MELLIVSFLAGLLTVLAPCVLALLPVILGGSLGQKNPWRPVVIAVSLGVSVVVFTLLLKATTALFGIPDVVWKLISSALLVAFGVTMLFPSLWDWCSFKLGLHKSEKLMEKSSKKEGLGGALLLGASLGPVFTTCSPTYAVILAVVLPSSFVAGFANLLAYALGLSLLLLAIGYGGQVVTKRLRFAANPRGWFKRGLGVLLILTGIAVLTGYDKVIEAQILKAGYLGPIQLEQQLLDGVE